MNVDEKQSECITLTEDLTIRFRRRYLIKIITPIKTKRITTIATKIIE
jgi:hypothetical protein